MPPYRPEHEALKKFSAALDQFTDAADKLGAAWLKLRDVGIAADVTNSYPFHKDFLQLLGDINGWRFVIRKMVKMGWPGPREWLPPGPRE